MDGGAELALGDGGTDIQGASTIGLSSVTVDVTWPEGDTQRKVELVNYFAQRTSSAQVGK